MRPNEAMRLHRVHCQGCSECSHVGQVMHITERGHRQLDRLEREGKLKARPLTTRPDPRRVE